jgi:hypothetical protein
MKLLIKLTVCFLFVWIVIWSCKKETQNQIFSDHQPVAKAGTDQTIILPNNAVTLDGSHSSDPDNNIAVYQWTKISGPATYNILQVSSAITEANNLSEGLYQFELTVKDVTSRISKDTVNIFVYGILMSASFTEEFDSVYKLESKGWWAKDNSLGTSARWLQGRGGYDKAGIWYGFAAYSFTTSQDEFVYASVASAYNSGNNYTISSWLITPSLSVKNGDKFSFYTRSDSGLYVGRMQVLMSPLSGVDIGTTYASTGDFTIQLLEINQQQVISGYPKTWTKYEYTFSGLSDSITVKIAFRYFVQATTRARGIGIDLFRFEKF